MWAVKEEMAGCFEFVGSPAATAEGTECQLVTLEEFGVLIVFFEGFHQF